MLPTGGLGSGILNFCPQGQIMDVKGQTWKKANRQQLSLG